MLSSQAALLPYVLQTTETTQRQRHSKSSSDLDPRTVTLAHTEKEAKRVSKARGSRCSSVFVSAQSSPPCCARSHSLQEPWALAWNELTRCFGMLPPL